MGFDRRRAASTGRAHRWLEIAAVVAAATLGTAMAWEVAAAADPGKAWLLVGALLLAHPAADLVSGLVHWSADRVLSEQTPWLGPNFVRPFREHHHDPTGIVSHDFIETNGNTCIVLVPALAGLRWLVGPAPAAPAVQFLVCFALGLAFWLCLTNQFHKWAHDSRSKGVVRWLQRRHLVLDPAHHAVHHRPPFDRRFCITSGWWNRPLDASGWLARRRREASPPALAAARPLAHAGRREARGDRQGRQHPARHRGAAR